MGKTQNKKTALRRKTRIGGRRLQLAPLLIGRRLIDSFLLFRGGILPAVPKGEKDLPRRIRTGLEQAKNNSSWQIAKLVFADIFGKTILA